MLTKPTYDTIKLDPDVPLGITKTSPGHLNSEITPISRSKSVAGNLLLANQIQRFKNNYKRKTSLPNNILPVTADLVIVQADNNQSSGTTIDNNLPRDNQSNTDPETTEASISFSNSANGMITNSNFFVQNIKNEVKINNSGLVSNTTSQISGTSSRKTSSFGSGLKLSKLGQFISGKKYSNLGNAARKFSFDSNLSKIDEEQKVLDHPVVKSLCENIMVLSNKVTALETGMVNQTKKIEKLEGRLDEILSQSYHNKRFDQDGDAEPEIIYKIPFFENNDYNHILTFIIKYLINFIFDMKNKKLTIAITEIAFTNIEKVIKIFLDKNLVNFIGLEATSCPVALSVIDNEQTKSESISNEHDESQSTSEEISSTLAKPLNNSQAQADKLKQKLYKKSIKKINSQVQKIKLIRLSVEKEIDNVKKEIKEIHSSRHESNLPASAAIYDKNLILSMHLLAKVLTNLFDCMKEMEIEQKKVGHQ